jgi:hypothetical protein
MLDERKYRLLHYPRSHIDEGVRAKQIGKINEIWLPTKLGKVSSLNEKTWIIVDPLTQKPRSTVISISNKKDPGTE